MTKPTSKRGFASLSPERMKEIASLGGSSIPPEKRSFSTNPQLASSAGKKGGQGCAPANRSFTKDPDLARRAAAIAVANRAKRKMEQSDDL